MRFLVFLLAQQIAMGATPQPLDTIAKINAARDAVYQAQHKQISSQLAEELGLVPVQYASAIENVITGYRDRSKSYMLEVAANQLSPWAKSLCELDLKLRAANAEEAERLTAIAKSYAKQKPSVRIAELDRLATKLSTAAEDFELGALGVIGPRQISRISPEVVSELRDTLERVMVLLDMNAAYIENRAARVQWSAMMATSVLSTWAVLHYVPFRVGDPAGDIIVGLFYTLSAISFSGAIIGLGTKTTGFDLKLARPGVLKLENEALTHWQETAPTELNSISSLVHLYSKASQAMLCELMLAHEVPQLRLDTEKRVAADEDQVEVEQQKQEPLKKRNLR